SFAQARRDVDPGRIGFLGVSLGGSLALSVASQDERIHAVADYYGPIPDLAVTLARRMPPVLLLHGSADPIVPVDDAYKTERLLKAKGYPFEMKIYPGEGHGFTGAAADDAAERTLQFFEQHLK